MVCGAQSSLCAAFETLSFVAGMYLSDPHKFLWLMMGSLGVVSQAAALYLVYVLRGGHTRPHNYQRLAAADPEA